MRQQGKIIKWHDDKGYGFVRATSDSKEVFLHISDIHRLNKRPEINELVSYELMKDARGRFRATHVAYQNQSTTYRHTEQQTKLNATFLVFILMFFTLVIERTLKGFLPVSFTLILFGANLTLFLYYYQDKTSAMKKAWRTPESTLHWLSLIGGWPSAYVAQKLFNHKHKKQSFVVTYKLTVLINCIAVMLYSLPYLQNMLISLLTK
ncbi:MAG: cold shock and DUF1294 domain-containing protein [Methylotenera sp.]|nr:cold shock and DUF1294 domain-containing protein [Methylotenera sp.]